MAPGELIHTAFGMDVHSLSRHCRKPAAAATAMLSSTSGRNSRDITCMEADAPHDDAMPEQLTGAKSRLASVRALLDDRSVTQMSLWGSCPLDFEAIAPHLQHLWDTQTEPLNS